MSFPDKPGVYLFRDKLGNVIYVGKAKSLKKRLASYFRKPQDTKVSFILKKHEHIDYILTNNELQALLLENKLIKKFKPKYNIALRDDKQYPYLKLTMNEEYPRLIIDRKKIDDGALYFGPFEGKSAREALRQVCKFFPIRWCKKFKVKMQPCMHFYLKQCFSPCVGKISHEEYMNLCRAIALFLSGDILKTIEKLEDEMQRLSKEKKYEEAARIRNRIVSLKKMEQGIKRKIKTSKFKHTASIRASKPIPQLQNLKALQKTLVLKKPLHRIEAFDVSNIQGSNVVGAMVVFEDGLPKKSDYRRFKVRSVGGEPNDIASIFEITLRRYTKTLKNNLVRPDLVLIDGGIAQVRSAKKALNYAKLSELPVIGLAKREEEIFFPDKNIPIRLPKDSPSLHLLQRIRDEAHRFAIRYNRLRRRKEIC